MNVINDYMKMISNIEFPPTLKKIKVSPKLFDLIRHYFSTDVSFAATFPIEKAIFQGIDVEIDWDERGYTYEEVY